MTTTTTMTQNDLILAHLQSGQSLTPLDALRLVGSLRLSARINDLRMKGFNIQTKIVKHQGKRFACYYLPKKVNLELDFSASGV